MSAHVYRLIGPCESLLYVGCTTDLIGRLRSHRARFGAELVRHEAEAYENLRDALEAERIAIQREEPLTNQHHKAPPVRANGFGAFLWSQLERAGYSIADAAKATEIPLPTLRRRLMDHDARSFHLDELARIATVLGTTTGALVTEIEATA